MSFIIHTDCIHTDFAFQFGKAVLIKKNKKVENQINGK